MDPRVPPVVLLDDTSLNLAPYNPNEMTPEERASLRASIDEHGLVENLVVQKYSPRYRLALVLVGGHQRLREVRDMRAERGLSGPFQVPCVVLDISDDEAVRLNAALNKIRGTPNPELLGRMFAQVLPRMTAANVAATGYTREELDGLVRLSRPDAPPSTRPPKPDEDVIPEPPRVPVTKVGDVWKLGRHVLVCGDCFDEKTRKRVLSEPIDLVLTDPPYAIYGSSTGIGADITDDRMVRPFFEQLFRVVERTLKPFGHAYVCCDWRSYAMLWESSRAARTGGAYGVWPKNCIVWDKGGSGLGSNYANTYELVAYFMKLPTPKAMKGSSERGIRSVLKPNIVHENRPHGDDRQHNAAKSPALFRGFVENSTDAGERAVDFFGGSGTTLVACEQLGRVATVFEVEPKYCDVIVERWERLSGGKAKRKAA